MKKIFPIFFKYVSITIHFLEVRNAKLRRNLHVTIGTIHMIKNSSLSRICDIEIQELEEFKMELEQLQKFPQEPPSLHWAIGELATSHTLWDEIINTVRAFLMLLGEPPESLKVTSLEYFNNISLKHNNNIFYLLLYQEIQIGFFIALTYKYYYMYI